MEPCCPGYGWNAVSWWEIVNKLLVLFHLHTQLLFTCETVFILTQEFSHFQPLSTPCHCGGLNEQIREAELLARVKPWQIPEIHSLSVCQEIHDSLLSTFLYQDFLISQMCFSVFCSSCLLGLRPRGGIIGRKVNIDNTHMKGILQKLNSSEIIGSQDMHYCRRQLKINKSFGSI